MPIVRTVFQPDTPREVDEHEAALLEREGHLLPLEPEDQAAAPKPGATVTAAASSTTTTPAKEASTDGSKQ